MFGAFFVPRSPVHGRQIPAKKNGSLSGRSNHRHSTAPLGVFLSGSEKAVAGTMQRCSRSSQLRHWLFLSVRKFEPQLEALGLREAEVLEAVGEEVAWEEVASAWDRAAVREALH